MMIKALEPDNPFWQFSCQAYAHPPLAEECLRWQDDYGANVNAVLFCLWLADQGISVTDAQLDSCCAAVTEWQDGVVRPLRNARRAFRRNAGVDTEDTRGWYQQARSLELAAEQHEQALWYARWQLEAARLPSGDCAALPAARVSANRQQIVVDNLGAYARWLNLPAATEALIAATLTASMNQFKGSGLMPRKPERR